MIRTAILLATLFATSPALASVASIHPCHEDEATWSIGGGIELTPQTIGPTVGASKFRFGVDRRIDSDRWLTLDGHLHYASRAAPLGGLGTAGFVGFASSAKVGMRYLVNLSYVDVSVFGGVGVSYTNQKLEVSMEDFETTSAVVSPDLGIGTVDEPDLTTVTADLGMSAGGQKYLGLDVVGGIDLERRITDGIGLRLSTTVVGLSYYTELGVEGSQDYKAVGVKLDSSLQLRFYF